MHIWHALRNNSMLSSAKQLCEITTFVVFCDNLSVCPYFYGTHSKSSNSILHLHNVIKMEDHKIVTAV